MKFTTHKALSSGREYIFFVIFSNKHESFGKSGTIKISFKGVGEILSPSSKKKQNDQAFD